MRTSDTTVETVVGQADASWEETLPGRGFRLSRARSFWGLLFIVLCFADISADYRTFNPSESCAILE